MAEELRELGRIVLDSGLIAEGSSGIVLVSGGADSAALAAGAGERAGAGRIAALHLNYGLRDDSDEDEAACRRLAERLGIPLEVGRPQLGAGNVQAEARRARYEAAERLAERRGADWIATGHTRTDLAETVLYRLATSPGRRALLALPERRGRIVRPLLAAGRAEIRELAEAAELPFRDDPSNVEPRYARNRIRNEVMPVLAEISPALEEVIAETRAELAEESEALEALATEALEEVGAEGGAAALAVERLVELHPALRRLALRRLAERAAGRQVPLSRARAAEIMRLAREPEGGSVDLGGGLSASLEHGHVRFSASEARVPEAARLPVPGRCRFGSWELRAELFEDPPRPSGAEEAVLDPASLGEEVIVRAWREGDRMRPLGLGGTKSLQDLFTDRKVPRSLRRTLPLVVAGDRIAWVAGVAVSEELAWRRGERAAVITARATVD